MKKTITALCLISTVLTGSFEAHAEDINDKPVMTKAEYDNYLQSNDAATYKEYKALNSTDENTFYKSMTTPNKLEKVIKENATEEVVDQVVDVDGFIEPTVPYSTSVVQKIDHVISGKKTVTLLGIRALQYKMTMKYRVVGGKIDKVLYSDANVIINRSPSLRTYLQSSHVDLPLSKSSVTYNATFAYQFGWKAFNIQWGTVTGKLKGYPNGGKEFNMKSNW